MTELCYGRRGKAIGKCDSSMDNFGAGLKAAALLRKKLKELDLTVPSYTDFCGMPYLRQLQVDEVDT
jgi:hypothetical protein